jgi:hypothetical protein
LHSLHLENVGHHASFDKLFFWEIQQFLTRDFFLTKNK